MFSEVTIPTKFGDMTLRVFDLQFVQAKGELIVNEVPCDVRFYVTINVGHDNAGKKGAAYISRVLGGWHRVETEIKAFGLDIKGSIVDTQYNITSLIESNVRPKITQFVHLYECAYMKETKSNSIIDPSLYIG